MLRRVTEIPEEPKALKEPFAAKDVRAFLASGMDMAELVYPGKTAASIANSAFRYRRKRGWQDKFSVVRRKDQVFLVRTPEAGR